MRALHVFKFSVKKESTTNKKNLERLVILWSEHDRKYDFKTALKRNKNQRNIPITTNGMRGSVDVYGRKRAIHNGEYECGQNGKAKNTIENGQKSPIYKNKEE